MKLSGLFLSVSALSMIYAPPLLGQVADREPTDVYIRRLAGLPASSADGQIKIIDVGHHPLDPMISLVANKTDERWSVSYACASSPRCAPSQDYRATSYFLSAEAGAEVDDILKELRSGAEPEGPVASPHFIGGHIFFSIDYLGFKRIYRRTVSGGATLSKLQRVLASPAE